MPEYLIRYEERETMPNLLERKAKELDLTVEQLVKRFINQGMSDYEKLEGPAELGTSLEDFLVKNGALKKE